MDFGQLQTDRRRRGGAAARPRLRHAPHACRRGVCPEALGTRFERIVCVDYQPTCENMLADFAARIAPRLPEGVELYALRLHETATSYAEWVADDNN